MDLSLYSHFGSSNCLDSSLFCQPTTTELWKVDGQIGGTTKELSIGSPDTGVLPSEATNWVWTDGMTFQWSLGWDSLQEIASFTLSQANGTSETLNYDLEGILPVNGLQLTTFVGPESQKLAAGTQLKLTLKEIDGKILTNPITVNAINTVEQAGSQNIYLASDWFLDGFELAGTVSFDWPNTFNPQQANANARAFFQLEANHADLETLNALGLKEESVSLSSHESIPPFTYGVGEEAVLVSTFDE